MEEHRHCIGIHHARIGLQVHTGHAQNHEHRTQDDADGAGSRGRADAQGDGRSCCARQGEGDCGGFSQESVELSNWAALKFRLATMQKRIEVLEREKLLFVRASVRRDCNSNVELALASLCYAKRNFGVLCA